MKFFLSVLFLTSSVCVTAFADAPVVDYSSNAPRPVTFREESVVPAYNSHESNVNLSSEQRIRKLENQINNINSQKLTDKIEELQQQVQSLNGQVETQSHQIEQLSNQLKGFYQDLNQRLEDGKPSAEQKTSSVMQSSNVIPATSINVTGEISGVGKKNSEETFLKEQQLYQTAIDMLPDKKYRASESKLREYIKTYPEGVYVANSHYWLGEMNFLQRHFDAAEEEFKIVIDKYSKSNRVADAKLKLALVHQNQGREAQAKKELNEVVKKYPGTSAAQLAKQQLAGM